MTTSHRRPSTHRVTVMLGVLVLVLACEDGSAVLGPFPDVDGTWSVIGTSVSGEGCESLALPGPVPLTVRRTNRSLEFEFTTSPSTTVVFRGSINEDGEFEMRWEREEPGFANERSTLEGSFVGDAFTATETTVIDFLDPGLIEIFGTDRCETVMRWEGERLQP